MLTHQKPYRGWMMTSFCVQINLLKKAELVRQSLQCLEHIAFKSHAPQVLQNILNS